MSGSAWDHRWKRRGSYAKSVGTFGSVNFPRFTEHHAFMVRLHLQSIDQLAAGVAELTARIDVMIEPFRPVLKLLTSIPG